MLYVYTETVEQQRQLEAQFSTKNSYYIIPSKQSYFLSEMLTSISHQFFQDKIPPIIEKIKEMIVQSFSATYNLVGYRQLIRLLKRDQQSIQMYREHLMEMNRAFADDNAELDLIKDEQCEQYDDSLFQQALKGQSHELENLDQFQLPLMSQLDLKIELSDNKTEKTMQSDLCWSKCAQRDIQKISGVGISNFDNVFGVSPTQSGQTSFQRWKQVKQTHSPSQLPREKSEDGSREMNSFKRKGSRIYNSNKNLKQIVVTEIKYDLNRQSKLGSTIYDKTACQPSKINFQKKMRSMLINNRIKLRGK